MIWTILLYILGLRLTRLMWAIETSDIIDKNYMLSVNEKHWILDFKLFSYDVIMRWDCIYFGL